jgi:hypothetical protein
LQRIVNASGGTDSVFGCGHVTKRDLHGRMMAFLDGIHAGRKADQARAEKAREKRESMGAFLNRP